MYVSTKLGECSELPLRVMHLVRWILISIQCKVTSYEIAALVIHYEIIIPELHFSSAYIVTQFGIDKGKSGPVFTEQVVFNTDTDG